MIHQNCLDRAAMKLKLIIECLYLRRQLNGWNLVPRNLNDALLAKQWQRRKLKNRMIAQRHEPIALKIIEQFGLHLFIKSDYNKYALQV